MNTQMAKTEISFEKLHSQLDQWKAEIDKLEAKAASATADAKLSYMREVRNLKVNFAEAEFGLKEVRDAQERASSDIIDGITVAWRDLGNEVSTAAQRFG